MIDLLHEARARPHGAELDRFLADACGEDADLKAQILSLLQAETEEGESAFLNNPGIQRAAMPVVERAGDKIGRYKLLEQIGEGGCGVVYMAEQEEPVRRRVALKVIKLGMDTRHVVTRFEAERQALALMEHNNIARVFDAGATGTGRPYFVMELVRGVKITDYCDEQNLSTEARLKLFMPVCQAIQHAHQKGIIHRDIKPSNVLVMVNDGVAVPKVIDFGIAKATEQPLTKRTVLTCLQQFIGTPAYMSPEQAEMTTTDIDTRSDIYSLGVLLYELLTGRTPFNADVLTASGVDGIRRIIREKEPPTLGTRLKTLSVADLESIAKRRRIEPRTLIALLRGDLEWIVLKCLEKERARRYETANGLATDLQRYLNDEPVAARPPSGAYRFGKMVRRNKAAFTALSAVAIALVLLTVGSTVAAWRVGLARSAEQKEKENADAANRELRDVNSRLADTVNVLELRRAEDFFHAHDPVAGVAQLAAILRRDPADQIAASRLVSALVHRNWALPAYAPMRHAERVPAVSFSPDGRRVLTASWDKTAKIWEASSGSVVAVLRHEDRVLSASYSADGARVVTASIDSTARVWNAADGRLIALLAHPSKQVWSAEFSPNGESVVTACAADHTVRIWSSATGVLAKELPGGSSEVLIACFAPDGRSVAAASRDGTIRIWDVRKGETSAGFQAHSGTIHTLAFSRDGSRLASGGEDGQARLWYAPTGLPVGAPLRHDSAVSHAVFSPDGRVLLTTSTDSAARLWDAGNLQLIRQPLRHEGGVTSGAFSPDGRIIVTTSMDNSARLWDVATGLPLCQPLREREAVLNACFSPDGRQLAIGSWDSLAQVWKIHPRRFLGIDVRYNKSTAAVAFAPGGESELSASSDETARLWNARTGDPLGEPMNHQSAVHCADFSADGKRIVTASKDGTVKVWDPRTRQVTTDRIQHAKTILSVQFSPDAERVLTASEDGTARVWDASTGEPLTPPLEHGATVKVARFSPDGRLLVTASDNRSARMWNAKTGQPVTQRLEHLDHVEWAEFSFDSRRVVSASSDNTAQVWEVQTGKRIGAAMQHARTVQMAVFSPDGRRVATASLDRRARIWDATTGESMTQPLDHDAAVSQIQFSPDGRRILTATWGGFARLWDSANGRPLTEWLDANGAVLSACFDSTGERIATGGEGGLRVWRVPPVPTPVPAWFTAFAESVAGTRWSRSGNPELVARSELEDVARQLSGEKAKSFYGRVGQWFLADPEERPLSPF
jgi:WD40 repeat protein/serine/threonine protein kinase